MYVCRAQKVRVLSRVTQFLKNKNECIMTVLYKHVTTSCHRVFYDAKVRGVRVVISAGILGNREPR